MRSINYKSIANLLSSRWFIMLYAMTCVVSYVYFDKAVMLFFRYQLSPAQRFVADIISGFGNTWTLLGILLLLFIWAIESKNKRLIRTILFALGALLLCALFIDIFKIILGRARPNAFVHYGRMGFYWFQVKAKMWSFPSGHSASISCVVMAFIANYDRFQRLGLIIITTIALSRVIVCSHWLSDVMAGAYLGALTSILIKRVIQSKYTQYQLALNTRKN